MLTVTVCVSEDVSDSVPGRKGANVGEELGVGRLADVTFMGGHDQGSLKQSSLAGAIALAIGRANGVRDVLRDEVVSASIEVKN